MVRDVLHHREVVCDEQVGEPSLALQLGEQVQHLGLNRYVQRAHRFVEHQELRLDRERPRDPDSLPLAAGQLVGVGAGERGVEPHLLQQRPDPPFDFRAGREPVDGERFGERLVHGHPRVERAVGVLEHDLHAAPQRPQLARAERQHLHPVERHAARVRLDEPEDGTPHRRLAASRLAHQAERLARLDRERHPVHGAHRATRAAQPEQRPGSGEVLHETVDLDEPCARCHARRSRRWGSVRSQQRTVWAPASPPGASSSGGSSLAQRSHA